jgi:hypothetical protein
VADLTVRPPTHGTAYGEKREYFALQHIRSRLQQNVNWIQYALTAHRFS